MAAAQRRPLPSPPRLNTALDDYEAYMGMPASYPHSAYVSPFPYQAPFSRQPDANYDEQSSTLRGGTLLHKGFYDLLSLIPSTPSPSRLFWRAQNDDEPVAGPRYEEIPPDTVPTATEASTVPQSPPPKSPPSVRAKGRRISKDMVSKPMNFMYVSTRPLQ